MFSWILIRGFELKLCSRVMATLTHREGEGFSESSIYCPHKLSIPPMS